LGKPRAQDQDDFDHNKDRYPDAKKALARIQQEGNLPRGGVERLEVSFFADGALTYRVWEARAEEPDGGYLPPA